MSGWRQKEIGIRWIFSQEHEIKSLVSRYLVSLNPNLYALEVVVKDLIYLYIFSIIYKYLKGKRNQVDLRTRT